MVSQHSFERVRKLEERVNKLLGAALQKRKPLFIEFAGTPKSGKTTALNALQLFLKRSGVSVHVYQERASIAPLLDKGTAWFNTWVTCATLMGMIEAREDEKLDVFILDRGLFDGLVWIDWQEKTLRLSNREAETFRKFILTPRWWGMIDLVFVMQCDPRQSLEREYAGQITSKSGTIMNVNTLSQLNENLLAALTRYKDQMSSREVIDTSALGQEEVAMKVAEKMLDLWEPLLDEEVLCIPKSDYTQAFEMPRDRLLEPNWDSFVSFIDTKGVYIRRSVAETDDSVLQIVPVCVINNEHKYLTNLRYEPGESLHDTLANWAGGHVRKQDLIKAGSQWGSVCVGLKREVYEELALAELPEPRPVGLVHTDEDPRAARHLGVVFTVQIEDGATAASLEGKTIRERPDRRVKTEWMDAAKLATEEDRQKVWSKAINAFLRNERTG